MSEMKPQWCPTVQEMLRAGQFNLRALEEHVKTCDLCQRWVGALAMTLTDDLGSVSMRTHVCLRCGYTWQSLKLRPAVCPRCKSHRWDGPPGKPGRPRKS